MNLKPGYEFIMNKSVSRFYFYFLGGLATHG